MGRYDDYEDRQPGRRRPDAQLNAQRRRNSQPSSRYGSDPYDRPAASSRRSAAGGARSAAPAGRSAAGGARSTAPNGRSAAGGARSAAPNSRSAAARGTAGYQQADMAARKRIRTNSGYYEEERSRRQGQAALKEKKRKRNRRILFAVEGVLLCLVLVALFVISKWDKIGKASFKKSDVHVNELSEQTIQSMEGYRTIALFGKDEEGYHSDVIMIANINNKTGDVQLVSVLRDTFWNVPDASTGDENKYAKANNAFHTGGELNALKSLNKNLDLSITEYVTVDWQAVATAVDLMGGLEIDVPETMMGEINGYITDTAKFVSRYTTQLEHSGLQKLDGIETVAYCRIRHNNGGDDGRAQRQREVVNMMIEKAKTLPPDQLLAICDEVFPLISTNLTLADVIGMSGDIGSYKIVDTVAFPYHQLDAYVTGSCKVPLGLADDVKQLHSYLFQDESYTPSETVQQISNKIESITGLGIDDR